jgi:signal transduction histidine kinase/PAS domain-containing protein
MKLAHPSSPLRITFFYALLAVVVVGSVFLLHQLLGQERQWLAFLVGGWVIVTVSALIFYLLLVRQQRHYLRSLTEESSEREQTLQEFHASAARNRALVNAMPDMMFRLSSDGVYLDFKAEQDSDLLMSPDAILGTNIRNSPMPPAVVEQIIEAMERALESDQTQTVEYSLPFPDGERVYEARVAACGRQEVVAIVRDITEQTQLVRAMEQRIQERTRELSTLLRISRNLVSTLALEPFLDTILAELKGVIDYTAAAIFLLEGERLVLSSYQGPTPPEELPDHWQLSEARHALPVVEGNDPVIIPDVRADTEPARYYRAFVHTYFEQIPEHICTWMAVPLRAQDQVIGMLSLDHDQPNSYTAHDAELTLAFANQTAVAIENARLYRQEQIRRHQADTLLRAASVVSSTLEVDEVLDRILDQLQGVVAYDSASVQLLQGDNLQVIAGRGFPVLEEVMGKSFPIANTFPNHHILEDNAPLNLANVQDYYPVFREPPYGHIRGWLGVPLSVQDRIIGMITLDRTDEGGFDEEEVRLATAFADLAALALENARLYSRAEQAAVLEERHRLARELHDSVSQALYGIALGARTARTLVERDPARVAEPVDYVLSLAEAGLAEMRALIFELRPESLEKEGLVAVLNKQAASLRTRHGLVVEIEICCDEPLLPIDKKEALYRVAQEAMNNVTKHAQATQLDLRLKCNDGILQMEVCDDGIGFDATASYPGHLGLHTMRERVAKLHGQIVIDSQIGKGTNIVVTVPM